MSDKLVKTESAVEPAKAFVDAVERVLKPVETKNEAVLLGGPHDECARCTHPREHHCVLHDESHCLMSGCKCKSFQVFVHIDTAIAAIKPALERCPNCGSTNMRDAQAQFVGACSARCAKALGIPEEVMRASGRVPPSQLGVVERNAPDSRPACRKCGGCGTVSVPGELADTTCHACYGTGIDDVVNNMLAGTDLSAGVKRDVVQIVECGAESPPLTDKGDRAVCSRLVGHDGSHGGKEPTADTFVTWQSSGAW